jgi:hypothetical protein
MLRNQIYAGWVVSGENKVKGLHQPLVTQDLFDAVQDALDGKGAAPVVHNTGYPPEFVGALIKHMEEAGVWTDGLLDDREWWDSNGDLNGTHPRDFHNTSFTPNTRF